MELQPNALGAQLRSGSLGASDSVVTLSLVRQLKSINNKKAKLLETEFDFVTCVIKKWRS